MEDKQRKESDEIYEEDNFLESESNSVEEIDQERIKQKKRRDFLVELFLFFVLGVLLGVVLKTEANKKIAIGFDDYKMKIQVQDYNIGKLQKDLIAKQIQAEEEAEKNSTLQQETPKQDNSN